MYTSNKLFAFSTLLCSAFAQTPSGFSPSASTKLGVAYTQAGITVTPGLAVPRADTATAPTITTPTGAGANASSTYMLFMLDLDVSQNNTRTTLLHWYKSDLVLDSTTNNTLVTAANNKTGPGAAYLQPSPPVGDIAHRYTQILFAQPSNFTVPSAFASINPPASTTNRIGFNLSSFVSAANLGSPIAGNFMTVQQTNTTATSTTSTSSASAASATAAETTASATTFSGGASSGKAMGYALAPLASLGAVVAGMLLM